MSLETAVEPAPKKLSSYMLASISILALVGFISILLILFGDFEDKMSRVVCTFTAFAIFTIFTALDTSAKRPKNVPVAAFFNIVILSLALSATWLGLFGQDDYDYDSSYRNYYDGVLNFFQIIGIALIGRLGSMMVQKALQFSSAKQEPVKMVSLLSAASIGITTVLFILPIGFSRYDFGDMYWKIVVAFVLLAGLSISILSLLLWFYREEGTNPYRNPLAPRPVVPPVPPRSVVEFHTPVNNFNEAPVTRPQPAQQAPEAPVAAERGEMRVPDSQPAYAPPAPPVQELRPWPLLPNGQPLPALSNGQPDFEALHNYLQQGK
ncbi:MAG: hypothetical protein H9W81_09890 [Enterococcus sp.]|nr:hypothetical protein [Enterococcus sp.]